MRKSEVVTITEEGRDKGKQFLIEEMPASQAESWALRAILALMRSGVDIPDDYQNLGMAGIAAIGVKALAGLSWELSEPLLVEMWGCVKSQQKAGVRPLIEEDIEEPGTRFFLRGKILELHTGFSLTGAPSIYPKGAAVVQPVI